MPSNLHIIYTHLSTPITSPTNTILLLEFTIPIFSQPLMDIGVCSATPEGNSTTCTGRALPTLSPKLETLKGPGDLYQYWLKTKPSETQTHTAKDEL